MAFSLGTMTAWVEENKDKVNEAANKRYKALKQQTPKWLIPEELEQIKSVYATALFCSRSLGEDYHVDHIVPLRSKLVCGLHNEFNLQIMEGAANVKKGNRIWPEMP